MRVIHYRVGVGGPTLSNPTACSQPGFNVPDTEQVTCFLCQSTSEYKQAAAQFREVVEALAYPKEDHPCLTHHPSTTAPDSAPPASRRAARR